MLCASKIACPECFQFLSAGADVNQKNDGGRTALHYAASKGRFKIAELLLSHGAKLNAKDKACAYTLTFLSLIQRFCCTMLCNMWA